MNHISNSLYFRILLILCFGVVVYSCATPSSPTGGPRDNEAPKITSTEPETGTTNFKGNQVVLHFSEWVNRASLQRALEIEPNLGLIYGVDWGRKSVAIKFDRKLPDLTTLIITVGTDFSDLNNNKLASPQKIAFSTGPDIDKGELTGRVLDARTGKGEAGGRVLLYRMPVDLSQPANYIGETDTSGTVHYSYLRQGTYKAFWVDDRNRDKIWEPDRERAQPFTKESVTLEKAGSDSLGLLYIANSDTSKPALQGVGLFSSQRMRLRFDENIKLTDSTEISITDSTGVPFSSAYPLYSPPTDPYILFVESEKPMAENKGFKLLVKNITDVAGNVQFRTMQSFTGSAQKDTTRQRIIDNPQRQGIFPDEGIDVTYARPIIDAAVRDSIKIIKGDSLRTNLKNLHINRNKVTVLPDGEWEKGTTYNLKFWNPATKDYKTVTPIVWHPSDLGSISITFSDTTSEEATRKTHLILKDKQGERVADTTFVKHVKIEGLAPVEHQLILFQDLNDNDIWDFGGVDPFKVPEPYFIRNNIPVQKGLTSDLDVSFKL